nr:globin [Paenibacillus donghaensis]
MNPEHNPNAGTNQGERRAERATSYYEQAGGAPTMRRLVEAFYPRVVEHPLLAPLFPEDIHPVMDKQEMFLTQYFGGPQLYTMKEGHPRMRARHIRFPITPDRATAWLSCMQQAMDEVIDDKMLREQMMERLAMTAYFFVNTDEQEADY